MSQSPAPVDVQVVTINTPVSGNNLSAGEMVSITLKNQGTQPVKNLKVAYQIDQSVPVVEVIPKILGPGVSVIHSFAVQANLSVHGSYTFKAFSMAPKTQFQPMTHPSKPW